MRRRLSIATHKAWACPTHREAVITKLKEVFNTPKMRNRLSQIGRKIGQTSKERRRRSIVAKQLGFGKWMAGRKLQNISKANKWRKGKTYIEIYGSITRAKKEERKRRVGNRRRYIGVPRKPSRPKQNGDWRYSNWRTKVFTRDNFTCQKCGKKGGQLHAHHIKKWSTHANLRYVVSNGLTLCADPCHKQEHKRK